MANDGEIILSAPGHADVTLPVSKGYFPEIDTGQMVETTANGVILVTEANKPITSLKIPFSRLTRAQISALKSIIEHVNYSEGGITVTDPYDTYENMHYISGLHARWTRGDEYACIIELKQSTQDEVALGNNQNIDSDFSDSAAWTATRQTYDQIEFKNKDNPPITAQIPSMLRITDASDGYNRVVSNAAFPVTDYVHEVSCAVFRSGFGDKTRLFCQFFNGNTAITGSAGTQSGWAERSAYHYWATITNTTVRVGSSSKTFAPDAWNMYTFQFGRIGGQIPANADTFKIGLESGSGGGVNISYWYFTFYTATVIL